MQIQYDSTNMLPEQDTILAQSKAVGQATLQQNQQSQGIQLSKYASAYGINQPGVMAAAQQGIQNGTDVASQNFQARMYEATIRSQIHQSYMGNLWNQFKFQKKRDKFGMIGAGLGAVGLAGVTLAHPDTPGNKFQKQYTDSHIGGDGGSEEDEWQGLGRSGAGQASQQEEMLD